MGKDLYCLQRKMFYKELQPVWKILSNINYAVVKGEALSLQIYKECNRRHSSDIDILIDKKYIKLLEDELKKLGFQQHFISEEGMSRINRILCLTYSHQIPSYYKSKYGFHFNIDINYDIFWGEYEGKKCDIDCFLKDATTVEIYGEKVKILSIEKAFAQLALHHYKEMNSIYHLSYYNCIRTSMFKDIYDFIKFNKGIFTVEKLVHICECYSIGHICYYMLYFVNRIYNDSIISNYLNALSKYADFEILDSFGLCDKERKKWKISFEKRLDNDDVWNEIVEDMNEYDLNKIIRNKMLFG